MTNRPSQPKPGLSMSATDWLLLLVLSVLWGGSFYFAKIAVLEIPPLTLALGRVGIAAAALLQSWHGSSAGPFPRDRGGSGCSLACWRRFNNAIPFTLMFWGQLHISIGLASILNATTPLFGVLVAHVADAGRQAEHGPRRRPARGLDRRRRADRAGLLGELGADVLAEFACLAAAMLLRVRRGAVAAVRGLPPMMVAAGQLTMSTVLLLPLVCCSVGRLRS